MSQNILLAFQFAVPKAPFNSYFSYVIFTNQMIVVSSQNLNNLFDYMYMQLMSNKQAFASSRSNWLWNIGNRHQLIWAIFGSFGNPAGRPTVLSASLRCLKNVHKLKKRRIFSLVTKRPISQCNSQLTSPCNLPKANFSEINVVKKIKMARHP